MIKRVNRCLCVFRLVHAIVGKVCFDSVSVSAGVDALSSEEEGRTDDVDVSGVRRGAITLRREQK